MKLFKSLISGRARKLPSAVAIFALAAGALFGVVAPASAAPAFTTAFAATGEGTGTYTITDDRPAAGLGTCTVTPTVIWDGQANKATATYDDATGDVTITGTYPEYLIAKAVTVTYTVASGDCAGAVLTSQSLTFNYYNRPTVTSTSPSTVLAGTTTANVTVNGTGFSSGATVTVCGTAATSVNVVSATKITMTVPSKSAGPCSVVVTSNGLASSAGTINYAAIGVTSISPKFIVSTGGSVTVTGFGFAAGATVSVNGGSEIAATGISGTSLTFAAPSMATAGATEGVAVSVKVTVGANSDTLSGALTYTDAPTVASVAPSSGSFIGGDTVVITGTRFWGVEGASAVTFGGVNATSYTVDSNTKITAVTPPNAAGAVTVAVTNGVATGTKASAYTYTAIEITSLNKTAGPIAGGNVVEITGSGFSDDATVLFGSNAATVDPASTATKLIVTVPAHAAGLVDVIVAKTPNQDVAQDAYRYVEAATITNVSPATGSVLAGTPVTITGTNFFGVTSVKFGTASATEVEVNGAGTTITAKTPANAAGAVKIFVTTAFSSTPAESATTIFTYAAPAITAITPKVGTTSGGTLVVITGTNFVGASAVNFGTAAVTPLSVNAAGTSISVVTPAGSGTVDVKVTVGATSDTEAAAFTYVGAPTITDISPDNGVLAGGNTVTITGTNLAGLTSVKFGTVAGTNVVVNQAGTSATVKAPAASVAGAVTVTVTGPGGEASVAKGYTYTSVVQPKCTAAVTLGQITFKYKSFTLDAAQKLKIQTWADKMATDGCKTVTIKRWVMKTGMNSVQKAMTALTKKRVAAIVAELKAAVGTDFTLVVKTVRLTNQVTVMTTVDQKKVNRSIKLVESA